MANPSPSARITPTGFKMGDGYRSLITFARKTNVQFWEKVVKPAGLDGGEEIDTATMHNNKYRTRQPRHLVTLTEQTVKALYDPDFYTDILGMVNARDTITHAWPDGSTLAYFGYLKKADFDDLEDGKPPMVTLTIVATNEDPATGNESPPVFTAATGT